MEPSIILTLAGGLLVLGGAATVVYMKKRTAYLGPVKEELKKEKGWLRRGEYNAAMVKGRQNLELLLKLVAEKNGIQLDNTAQAVANAREEEERRNQEGRRHPHRREKTQKVMTHQQFNRWLSENGYLDRVARWEMNQVRLIGNKAVHENYGDKDAAWNQYNYLEDILKTITEHSQNPKKHHEHAYVDTNMASDFQKKKRRRKKKTQGVGNAKNVKSGEAAKAKPKQENSTPAPANVNQNGNGNAAETEETKKPNRRRRKPQNQVKAEKPVKAESKPKPQKPAKQQNQPKSQKPAKQQNQPKSQKPAKQQNQPKQQSQAKPTEQAAAKNTGERKPNHHRRRRPHTKPNKEAAGGTVKTEKKNENH